jgi:hypothetical protein
MPQTEGDLSPPIDPETGMHPAARQAEREALPHGRRWARVRRHWLSVWEAAGQSWNEVAPKRLPAFWLHPDTRPHRYRAPETLPGSFPEALATQTVAWKGANVATPVRFTIPRVLPYRGELLGTVVQERKRCGDPNCKCASGRKEDRHGPYYYRRFRDGSGTLRKVYVQTETAEATSAGTRARRRRTDRQRKLRDLYLEEARPGGAPTIRDVIDGDASVERYAREANPAEPFARRVFGEDSELDGFTIFQ